MFRRSLVGSVVPRASRGGRILGALLLSSALVTGGCASSKKATEAPRTDVASLYGPDAAYAVGVTQSLSFEDPVRHRTLKPLIWYPVAPGTPVDDRAPSDVFKPFYGAKDAPLSDAQARWPLVLLSHGSGGSGIDLSWFGAHLAAHGFIVLSLNHPGNSYKDTSPEGFARAYERPKDFTVILDNLLKDPKWGPRVDPERIGASGHSMGGYTAMALVGLRLNLEWIEKRCTTLGTREEIGCEALRDVDYGRIDMKESRASYLDPRVKAAFAMAPGMAASFETQDTADIQKPVELILAKGDELMPHEQHGLQLSGRLPPATTTTVVLDDAGHFTFLPECYPKGFEVIAMLCKDPVAGTRATSQARTKAEGVAFFRRTLDVR
ncbi:alpha/beta fold hydrolase [Corallococcus sp. CA047B]|uniref:alpha/beta hydrolase family protein n=1 Tax=Corallococcus sp. CA047B TaxID=2316729 RepID=UPI000EA326E7|nr:alpha/beta fold hydrolase [Corallococcus sp. CA047B]RKH16472.1 alpha/beta fold hydrolase [Corallococcus sp. CA047B]